MLWMVSNMFSKVWGEQGLVWGVNDWQCSKFPISSSSYSAAVGAFECRYMNHRSFGVGKWNVAKTLFTQVWDEQSLVRGETLLQGYFTNGGTAELFGRTTKLFISRSGGLGPVLSFGELRRRWLGQRPVPGDAAHEAALLCSEGSCVTKTLCPCESWSVQVPASPNK